MQFSHSPVAVVDTAGAVAAGIDGSGAGSGSAVIGSDTAAAVAVVTGIELLNLGHILPQSRQP